MRKARKVKIVEARANDPKPGQQDQLELVIGETVGLMEGDRILIKFDQRRKTFAGFYIVDIDK